MICLGKKGVQKNVSWHDIYWVFLICVKLHRTLQEHLFYFFEGVGVLKLNKDCQVFSLSTLSVFADVDAKPFIHPLN